MKSFRLYRSFRILAVLAFLVLLGSCESPKPAVPAGPPAPKASKPEVVELPDFAQTGFRFVPQTGHTQGITKLAWHPSGEFFATSSSDKTVKIWNVDGTVVQDLQSRSSPGRLLFPDGKCLAVACWDNKRLLLVRRRQAGKKDYQRPYEVPLQRPVVPGRGAAALLRRRRTNLPHRQKPDVDENHLPAGRAGRRLAARREDLRRGHFGLPRGYKHFTTSRGT